MARRSGLGKGLSALIPTEESADGAVDGGLQEVPLSKITANRLQPRDHFDEADLGGLAESIRALGVLQPVLVRPAGDGYELIAGERRWRAAKRAGMQTIPVVVKEGVGDLGSLEQALVENLHRQDLNPLEEAAAYQQLVEDFGLTQEQVAQRVGRSRSSVANMLRLFQLPPAVQSLVGEGRLSFGHARALLGTPDRAYQESLARRVVADDLSVREVEEIIRERLEIEGKLGRNEPDEPRQEPIRHPGLLELEQLLSDLLSTRVKVSMGSKRGKVTIDFANLEDLERIYRLIGD